MRQPQLEKYTEPSVPKRKRIRLPWKLVKPYSVQVGHGRMPEPPELEQTGALQAWKAAGGAPSPVRSRTDAYFLFKVEYLGPQRTLSAGSAASEVLSPSLGAISPLQ